MTAYPIDEIEDQSHGDTELFKVQLAISVQIRQIPHLLQLVIAKPTVPQHGGGLRVVQTRLAIGERREDLPVPLDLPLLDPLV